jgi:phospholipid transport system substrate-binding protein|tara:strand:+ start:298 stop:915 length:618 start_codon:yes stop_codon:yes gene_type:complete
MLLLKKNLLVLFLFLSSSIYSDINKNPYELIDVKSQEMVIVLTTENELFITDPEMFKDKIKVIFEPLIDFNRVSASVMGKKYYLSATKEERAQFIEVFKISLLDTYAETLAQWGDAEIVTDFSYNERKNQIVSVKQNLLTTNNIYPIIYKLREYKNGTYKIVNIVINGINLGKTFHNQFQALAIEKNENISSIIAEWKSDAFIDG